MKLLRSLALLLLLSAPACAQDWPAGSVLLRRNVYGANTTPGFWNHSATYVSNGWVVEAQENPGRVIYTPLSEFISRRYQVGILFPRDPLIGQRSAAFARTQVGSPYRRYSSLAPALIPTDGYNCTWQVRAALEFASGRRLFGVRKPDDLELVPELLTNRFPQ